MNADAVFARTAARYRPCGRFAHAYVGSKLRRDPAHRAVLAMGEQLGSVLDIGCGRGQFCVALLEAGIADRAIGLDRNAALLEQAEKAASGLAFRAVKRDLAHDASLPDADTVLLIDVLYQLDTAAQLALLDAAARAARLRLLIRSADPARGWRSVLTDLLERGFRRVWPHAGSTVNPLPIATLAARLEAHGYTVVVEPSWQGTPFANVLLVARRARG